MFCHRGLVLSWHLGVPGGAALEFRACPSMWILSSVDPPSLAGAVVSGAAAVLTVGPPAILPPMWHQGTQQGSLGQAGTACCSHCLEGRQQPHVEAFSGAEASLSPRAA